MGGFRLCEDNRWLCLQKLLAHRYYKHFCISTINNTKNKLYNTICIDVKHVPLPWRRTQSICKESPNAHIQTQAGWDRELRRFCNEPLHSLYWYLSVLCQKRSITKASNRDQVVTQCTYETVQFHEKMHNIKSMMQVMMVVCYLILSYEQINIELFSQTTTECESSCILKVFHLE